MTFRRYLILGAVMVGASVGDTFLSKGMKQVGPVSLHHLAGLLIALKNPWVLSGIVFLILFFASYLTALSAAHFYGDRNARVPPFAKTRRTRQISVAVKDALLTA